MMHTVSSDGRTRLWLYWISAIGTTLVFLLFMATMLMVPGVLLSTKIWMLSVVAASAMVALGIGAWRFSSTEAPLMMWPLGTAMGVVLLLELLQCIIGIFQVTALMHR
jgi:hypothetical protein